MNCEKEFGDVFEFNRHVHFIPVYIILTILKVRCIDDCEAFFDCSQDSGYNESQETSQISFLGPENANEDFQRESSRIIEDPNQSSSSDPTQNSSDSSISFSSLGKFDSKV